MPAKLMKDRPSEVQQEPQHGRLAIVVGLIVLAVLTAIGLFLVISTGPEADEASDMTLEMWAADASEQCARVAEEHSAVDELATADLSAAIESIAVPTNPEDASSVVDVVQLGEHVANTWAQGDDAGGMELLTAYVAALNDLGADCSAFDS